LASFNKCNNNLNIYELWKVLAWKLEVGLKLFSANYPGETEEAIASTQHRVTEPAKLTTTEREWG
jgi:hypothetical protein